MQEAIDAGRLVIVPEHPVDLGGQPRLGWWIVDPVSGAAIDQMDDGGGIGTTEYVAVIVAGAVLLTGLALLLDYAKKFVIRGEEPSASPIEQNWMRDAADRADRARRREAIEQGAVRFRLNQYPTSSAGSP